MNKFLKLGWTIDEMRYQQGGSLPWYYFHAIHDSGESASADGQDYKDTWDRFCLEMTNNVPQWYKAQHK